MGIFSSKKTYVGTNVVRLVDDEFVPRLDQTSILEAILKDQNVSDTIIESMINDATLRYDQAYNYAKKGDYYYGLPRSYLLTDYQGGDLVKATLDNLEGESVNVIYSEFAPLNHVHMAWQELYNNLGYNPATNEITVLSGTTGHPVFLDKIVPVFNTDAGVVSPGAWADWNPSSMSGPTPERKNSSPDALRPLPKSGESQIDGAEIHTIWNDGSGSFQRSVIVVDLSAYEDEREYFQVKYTTTSGTKYWTYLEGEGTYALLDALYTPDYESSEGTYFPFVVFRSEDTNRAAEEFRETDAFKSTERILNYLGMDFVSVSDTLHENPDITAVDQAVLMMGIPAISTHQHDLRYLYDFFDRLELQAPDDGEALLNRASLPHDPSKPYVYEDGRYKSRVAPKASIALVFQSADFKMTLSYGGIIRSTKPGVIGNIGEYASTTTTTEYETSYYNTSESQVEARVVSEGINLVYQKQVSENLYEELIIIDPTIRYKVRGDYGTVGGAQSDTFMIPLDRSITKHYSQMFNSQLYPRSLHFVFNSRVIQSVKWYETGIFKFVLVAAAIVVTFVSGGLASFTTSLAVAAAAGITALSLFLIKIVVYQYLINYAFRIIVKEVGVETAFILAIIAVTAGITNSTGLPPGGDAFWAKSFLIASSGLIQGINDVTEELIEDLLDEYSEFNTEKELRLAELEKAEALLKDSPVLSPFVIFGESPEEYYERSIHTGNIGTRGFDYIESYVDMSLKLPDINDSFGGNYA